MSFSDRILAHPRISIRASTATEPLRLAVTDQLLVSTSAADQVHEFLEDNGIPSEPITTLLTGLRPGLGDHEDVEILRVGSPDALPDIFDLTADIRATQIDPRKVSPNHILIPANEDHSCPYGPPLPTNAEEALLEKSTDRRRVSIIDSGYQWDAAWGPNPLGNIAVHRAESLRAGGWKRSPADRPDANDDERLDALAGHANFVAGVVAQGTSHAKLEIRNHNGAFLPGDDLPTEASVVRSLCKCRGRADMINLGFAFAAFEDTPSCAWDTAFALIGDGEQGPVVVAPAGNQATSFLKYPAALHYTYPTKYPNMIGVGSTGEARDTQIPVRYQQSFSNFGPWVTCSAEGAGVQSTFLKVNMKVEDGDEEQFAFDSAWARWNGTSFATPKVVAQIVNVMVDRKCSAPAAWQWLRDNVSTGTDPDLGYIFPF
jgi:thermitase